MALRKVVGSRGTSWEIDFYAPGGKRVQKRFKLKKEAAGELAKIQSLISENRYLDVKRECETTFNQLAEKYIAQFSFQPSFRTKRIFITRFSEKYGEKLISEITYYDLERYRNKLKVGKAFHGRGLSKSSVNREISCLHHMFDKAKEWKLLDKSPFDDGGSLWFNEKDSERKRFLSREEISSLLSCITKPWLADVVECALHTGLRKQEVLNLKWEQVQDDFLYIQDTKTEEPREIPVNAYLSKLLSHISARNRVKSTFVFHRGDGQKINGIAQPWKAALEKAGIKNFRFHDLRHTFASHFCMQGGHLKTLQKILGHSDISQTMRYSHLSPEFAKEQVQLLNDITSGL